jgi:hypothetical protein
MEELMTMLIEMKENNKKLADELKTVTSKMTQIENENIKYKQIVNSSGTNNNINNGNQIYINILPYGSEDINKLSVSDYKRIFGRGMNSTPALVEKLHFDKNVPENHNVYISNLRDEYVLMYDGKKWRLKDRDEALQQLYEDKSDILETKFEELLERLDEPTIKMFRRFLKVKDDDDEKIKVIKKELKKVLYENREMVIATRKNEGNLLLNS